MPFDAQKPTAAPFGSAETLPMMRPAILTRAAHRIAAQYRRTRDLPGALPGFADKSRGELCKSLQAAEARCEEARRQREPGYRAGRHVLILGALLAEQLGASTGLA